LCGDKGNTYRVLVRKPDVKRSLGRPRRGWENHIKIDLIDLDWERVDWVKLAHDKDKWRALVKAVMNLRVP
jgi:hypothetical protein